MFHGGESEILLFHRHSRSNDRFIRLRLKPSARSHRNRLYFCHVRRIRRRFVQSEAFLASFELLLHFGDQFLLLLREFLLLQLRQSPSHSARSRRRLAFHRRNALRIGLRRRLRVGRRRIGRSRARSRAATTMRPRIGPRRRMRPRSGARNGAETPV